MRGGVVVSRSISWRVQIPAELVNWVINRQVSAHIRAVNAMLLGLALNVVVIVAALSLEDHAPFLAPFVAYMAIAIAHRFYLSSIIERKRQRHNPAKLAHVFALNSWLLGLATCGFLAAAFPSVSTTGQLLLAVAAATQIGATAYTTRTLPRAALPHIILIATGLTIGLARTGELAALGAIILTISATGVQAVMVRVANKGFIERILHDRELSETMGTVRMLLNDYESHSTDWLFELDDDARILSASDQFAEAAGVPPEDLNGRRFVDLFGQSPALTEMESHLANSIAFRGLTLKLKSANAANPRWWSISARPMPASNSRLARFHGVISDISSEKQAEARVRYMANYDSLTGLPNRLMFTSSLQRLFTGEISYNRIALLVIDCDNFKSVNDMFGHPVGDEFLKQVSIRLSQTVDSSGLGGEGHLIARLGGDEFVILVSGEDATDHGVRLAQLLIDAFKAQFEVAGHEIVSGISIGLALAPDHAVSADTLMSQADIALYLAKEEGRGRWEMFQSGMDEELQRRHALARDLRNAVPHGELRLFLQPLVNVETRKQIGFEALLRWQHPERGMVMPNDFIPIAEETGLIVPIGEWVIRTALAEAALWTEPHTIAINLSPIQLRSPGLLPTLIGALADTGIDPARVELEITETVLMNNSEANIAILNQLHGLGVKIALDDFGTGYASLNYLLTFPFDKIKIDRSFVISLEEREESRAIVGAVISLASKLGICTLAEGVEHEEQLAKLREQGCDMVQGWLFGKALPAGEYTPALVQDSVPNPALPRRRAA